MKHFQLMLLFWLSSAVAAHADPELNDRATCVTYAKTALEQYVRIKNIEGCYKGDNGRWHTNYERHYNWCMTASALSISNEEKLRAAGIERCIKDTGQ